MRITRNVMKASCITIALGLGLAVGCGKDDDDEPAAATYDLVVVNGDVDQFVAAADATAAPAYGLAVTQADIAADAAADSDVSYAIGAATDKIALTEWHMVTVTQDPANCASDSDITAAWADGAWSFTVKKDKVQGRSDACELTVAANMGEAVPASWVQTLLEEGVENGFKTDDETTAAKTKSCSGCHKFESSNKGDFDMKDADGFSFAVLLNNLESDDDTESVLTINYVAADALKEGDCSEALPEVKMKRIAPGDPNNSAVVLITNVTAAADGTTPISKLVDGSVAQYCDDTYQNVWMPKGKDLPVDGNDSTAWTAEIHDKFARWVLQGAKAE